LVLGQDSSVGIETRYGLGGSGDPIPVGGVNFRTHPHEPWAHPTSYKMAT